MSIYFSLLVCIAGLLMWILSNHAKVSEAGRIMFAFGLLAFLLEHGIERVVQILPHS